MIRSTRNQLDPLQWILLFLAMGMLIFGVIKPMTFIAVGAIIFIVFQMDADRVPLASTAYDWGGAPSLVGLTSGLILRGFTAVGAFIGAVRWLRSQLNQ